MWPRRASPISTTMISGVTHSVPQPTNSQCPRISAAPRPWPARSNCPCWRWFVLVKRSPARSTVPCNCARAGGGFTPPSRPPHTFPATKSPPPCPGERVVVLTGDLMNEYVCDYREEQVGTTIYYKVPRVPMSKRRTYFVRGLDAGDREIGVFSAYGLVACQPFVLLAEHYMRIPPA